jgi:hypothetical protein
MRICLPLGGLDRTDLQPSLSWIPEVRASSGDLSRQTTLARGCARTEFEKTRDGDQ